MLASLLSSLSLVRQRIEGDPALNSKWMCRTGFWPDHATPNAVVLKLLKPHWSDDAADVVAISTGIFFSVWVDDSALMRRGLHYNLHALKLRDLAKYNLQSRKFAAEFREHFEPLREQWPAVSVSYGPQTLFQGFVGCTEDEVEATAYDLVRMFIPLGSIVDSLLARAAK